MGDYNIRGGFVIQNHPSYSPSLSNNGSIVVETGIKSSGGTMGLEDLSITDSTIATSSNTDLTLAPDGTGKVVTDNLALDGNTLSSTDTNGDLILAPDGTGDLVLDGVNWPQADGATGTRLQTDGAGQTSWVDPKVEANTVVAATPYAQLATDNILLDDYTGTGASVINLIAAATFGTKYLTIKDSGGNAGTNNITINRAGADTIDGATSLTLSTNYAVTVLYSDGVDTWHVIV